ncbi:MAG: TonB family protein [Xanthomonadales bacterium]|nr:TonB family protein [Xanthomonadales bacterium]
MSGASEWIHDRFTVCLVLATGIHAAVVFGVSFGIEFDRPPKIVETLEVVLVNWRSEETPDEPDYLAQATQRGGGEEEDEKERPAQPLSGLMPNPNLGEDVMQAEEAVPEEQLMEREVVAATGVDEVPLEVTQVENPEPNQPTMAELRQESMQMANLQPELSRQDRFRSKLPRREYISANTQEYEFASYMSAWVAKVERVGNLNYPTELRRKRLHGDLVLTVGIQHDGSVEGIDVMRSSGRKEIDRAAIEIVRLASPYAPLPDNIRERVDVLHITRTWRFESAFGVD